MITIKEVNKGYTFSGYLGEINKENRACTRLSELIKCFNENNQECTDIILQNWDKSSEIYAFLRDNLYDEWERAVLDYDGVMNYARTIEDYEHEIALSFIEDLCEYCGISPDKNKQKENIEREEMIAEDYDDYDDFDYEYYEDTLFDVAIDIGVELENKYDCNIECISVVPYNNYKEAQFNYDVDGASVSVDVKLNPPYDPLTQYDEFLDIVEDRLRYWI